MLNHFAIGLAILIGQQPLWSIEVPWYFHKLDRQECYDYEHYNIEKIKFRRSNVQNIHLTYFYSNVLYVSIPNVEAELISASKIEIRSKRKDRLRLEIKTKQVSITGDGKKICLQQNKENEE